MPNPQFRKPAEDDWPAIVALADAALPWDAAGNREWLANRKAFDGLRRHYVAEDEAGEPVGYGALEDGPEPGVFRMFVVMGPADLLGEPGAAVYERLAEDLAALNARGTWVREYGKDEAAVAFYSDRGFKEENRFTPDGHAEMVVLVKRFTG